MRDDKHLYYDGHDGIDYSTGNATNPVYAAASGTTVKLSNACKGTIALQHNGYKTVYRHLSSFAEWLRESPTDSKSDYKVDVPVDAEKLTEKLIGRSGNTKCDGSTLRDEANNLVGVHLHFEVRKDGDPNIFPDGVPVDPYGWQGEGDDPYIWDDIPGHDLPGRNLPLWSRGRGGHLRGRVFVDSNGNQQWDPGEMLIGTGTCSTGQGVAGFRVTWGDGAISGSTTPNLCDNEGRYYDSGPIPPGSYTVQVTTPPGWSVVSANPVTMTVAAYATHGLSFAVRETTACSYTLSPPTQSFGASGGMGSVAVTTRAGCPWSASSSASWLTITSGSSGNGNGTVGFSVAVNSSTNSRQATITVQGQLFTVTQTGNTTCSYALTSGSQSFPASGGSGSVGVVTTSGCPWSASSSASWLTITSGSSGNGNGTVGFSVGTNLSTNSRQATITVQGQLFTVTQSGSTPPPAAPDLVVTQVTGPSCGGIGGTGQFTATVLNQGNGFASATSTGFYLSTDSTINISDLRLGSCGTSSLNPNQSTQCAAILTIPNTPGTFFIGAIANDSNAGVIESNPSNNALAGGQITVSGNCPGALGTILIQATLNGNPITLTSGSFTLTGPGETMNWTGGIPYTFREKAAGTWTISNITNGPPNSSLSSIDPSSTQVLSGGASITFILNFTGTFLPD